MANLKSGASFMGAFGQSRATGQKKPSIGEVLGDPELNDKIKGLRTAYKYIGLANRSAGYARGLTSLVAAQGKRHSGGMSTTQKQEADDRQAALDASAGIISGLQDDLLDYKTQVTDLQTQVDSLTAPTEPVSEPTEYFSEDSPTIDL